MAADDLHPSSPSTLAVPEAAAPSSGVSSSAPTGLLGAWLRLRDHLSDDFLGGPKVIKLAWAINLQKGGTLLFVAALMVVTQISTPTAWTYLALHGSYGLLWLLKERVFPDPGWQKKVTVAGAVNSWLLVLGLYWLAPVLLVVHKHEAPPWLLASATILYALGVGLMFGSDAQKFFVLKLKRGLITDGFFARVRHPNYLGEMMIYGSFALVAGHWIPWLVLAWVWTGLFLPNMLQKEHRMARHPGWATYRARTGMLLPRLRPARDVDRA
jgi:protein-S-isoprenylcysteine O-methyltransferase Ste14